MSNPEQGIRRQRLALSDGSLDGSSALRCPLCRYTLLARRGMKKVARLGTKHPDAKAGNTNE